MAASGKIDPMHQFTVEPLVPLHIGNYDISLTNSAAWMLAALAIVALFMWGGMQAAARPGPLADGGGRSDRVHRQSRSGEHRAGRQEVHALHLRLFSFILVANMLGLLPLAIVPGWHAFTPTSHFSITGVLAILSFSLVLIVGFWRHGLHFFSLFLPAGTPILDGAVDHSDRDRVVPGSPVQPRASTVRRDDGRPHPDGSVRELHRQRLELWKRARLRVGIVSFLFIVGVGALEMLICALQAYVFALFTSLYLSDAVNLH